MQVSLYGGVDTLGSEESDSLHGGQGNDDIIMPAQHMLKARRR